MVLDFTAGSFTTAIACINTNRQFIGIEHEMEWDTDFQFNFNHVKDLDTHIITNPPYKNTEAFITTALDIVATDKYVCFWLPIRYLSGIARKLLFAKYPLHMVIISASRIMCARNGNFVTYASSSIDFSWFIWKKGYTGDTILKWV